MPSNVGATVIKALNHDFFCTAVHAPSKPPKYLKYLKYLPGVALPPDPASSSPPFQILLSRGADRPEVRSRRERIRIDTEHLGLGMHAFTLHQTQLWKANILHIRRDGREELTRVPTSATGPRESKMPHVTDKVWGCIRLSAPTP